MNQNYCGNAYAQQPAPAMGYPYYGMQQQSMPVYNQQPMKQPEYTNPLGAARIKELLEKGNGGPKIALTEDDYIKAVCTHRYNGRLELVDMGDGKMRCKICGAEFTPVDEASLDDVKAATTNLMNILHTAKVAWLDVPDKVASEFFQALAVIEKTPDLFKIAMSNFQQYNGYNIQNTNMPVNGFGIMNQILGPQVPYAAPYGQPQQPYGQPQQPYAQAPYAPQIDPYGNPIYGGFNPAASQMQATAPGVSNGFGYNAPQAVDQGSIQTPQAAAPQAQPKAETVNKTLHV